MRFGHLQKLKKQQEEEVAKRTFFRYLIVGHDLFSITLYQFLREKFGEANVCLLSSKKLEFSGLRLKGPSLLRGEKNIATIKERYAETPVSQQEEVSLFYKDQKFRPFSGRSKPEKLLWGESFFANGRVDFDASCFFPLLENENKFNELKERMAVVIPTGVEQCHESQEDLSWRVSCSNGEIFESEFLFWGSGPKSFAEMLGDEDGYSNEFLEFCNKQKHPSSLYIRFVFEKQVSDMKETVFLPLSYSADWGHFIGEFKNLEDGKQEVEFVHFLFEEDTSEEEISKRIKILKRNVEKIFPDSKGVAFEEFIALVEDAPSDQVDDNEYRAVVEGASKLAFVGMNAPLLHCEESNLSHFARGIISLDEIKKSFS